VIGLVSEEEGLEEGGRGSRGFASSAIGLMLGKLLAMEGVGTREVGKSEGLLL
jgi:hypothetical protein